MKKIGFIGTGLMGRGIARGLLHPLTLVAIYLSVRRIAPLQTA